MIVTSSVNVTDSFALIVNSLENVGSRILLTGDGFLVELNFESLVGSTV